MHVGDRVLGAARRADPPAPAARRLRRAHLRRPLRGPAAGAGRRRRALRRGAARRRRAAVGRSGGQARMQVSISVGVAPLDSTRARSSRTRSPPPRPPARPPRTAAAIASRSTSEPTTSIVRRFTDINIAGAAARCHRRRAGCSSTRSSSCRSPPPRARAPHFELLLRMIGRERPDRRSGHFHVGGDALPADADHRPLGDQPRHRGAQAARRSCSRARRSASRSISPASRCNDDGFADFADRAHRRRAGSTRSCCASSSPRTPPSRTCRAPRC